MKQLRVCRAKGIDATQTPRTLKDGDWQDVTHQSESIGRLVVDAGNATYGAGTHWLEYRTLPACDEAPERAIRRVLERSIAAWTSGDMHAHLGYFTPGAVFVTPDGRCHRGRSELWRAFTEERARMWELTMTPTDVRISFPAADSALVVMEGTLMHERLAASERWATTQMIIRQPDGEWRIASLQVFHDRAD